MMRFFGAFAAALLVSAVCAGPVLAQDEDWDVEAPSSGDLLIEAAIVGLDEKAADKCDCSAGLDKYEACVEKQVASETVSFNTAKKLLKFFAIKKSDVVSSLQDEKDFLVATCDEELNGGGDEEDPSDGDGEFPDEEIPEF